jgi:hypothetical protein
VSLSAVFLYPTSARTRSRATPEITDRAGCGCDDAANRDADVLAPIGNPKRLTSPTQSVDSRPDGRSLQLDLVCYSRLEPALRLYPVTIGIGLELGASQSAGLAKDCPAGGATPQGG